ncbi:coiled-coil domain-containing protein 43 isoform X2 [Protopterus annectens]|uniref:coiled-coil domain-containing protein 43 isoform X2 n=1 Tax=Protopterus annectens TaxID=7888 RepID=UPI001CFA8645|nr:coiled-coil domain-containing protein 43 isoform X2 [Protopterus annectens]
MAAPEGAASGFDSWLNNRLEMLDIDKDVYASYIHGVLQEEDSEQERREALRDILSAFLEEDTLEEFCKEILTEWLKERTTDAKGMNDEVEKIANMIEKQAQIVVKQKETSEDDKQRKAALLAQYANVTDEEEYPFKKKKRHTADKMLNQQNLVAL